MRKLNKDLSVSTKVDESSPSRPDSQLLPTSLTLIGFTMLMNDCVLVMLEAKDLVRVENHE